MLTASRISTFLGRYTFVPALFMLLCGIGGTWWNLQRARPQAEAASFRKAILDRRAALDNNLQALSKGMEPGMLQRLYDDQQQAYFVYRNDSLIAWSDHHVPAERVLRNHCFDYPAEQLADGYYLVRTLTRQNIRYVGLQLIKHQYPFSNEYIRNEVPTSFGSTFRHVQISLRPSAGFVSMYDDDRNVILYINLENVQPGVPVLWVLLIGFSLAWLIWLISTLVGPGRAGFHRPAAGTALCLLACALPYMLPETLLLTLSGFFDPGLFAYADIMPSLAHLLLFSWCLYSWLRLLRRYCVQQGIHNKILSLILHLGLSLGVIFLFSLCGSIVNDSRIPLDTNNLLMLDATSFAAFLCIFIFFRILRNLSEWELEGRSSRIFSEVISWGLPLAAAAGFFYLFTSDSALTALFILFRLAFRLIQQTQHARKAVRDALQLFVFTLCTGFILGSSITNKQEERTALLAENLARPRDPVAEFLFRDVSKRMASDTMLADYLSRRAESNDALLRHISSRYLTGYWDRFDIRVFVYDSTCNIVARSSNALFDRYGALDTLFRSPAESDAPLRYFSETGEGATVMAGKVNLRDRLQAARYTLFTEFRSRSFNSETGFPALLLDQDVQTYEEWKDLSWAEYRGGKLFSHQGSYDYPLINTYASQAQTELSRVRESEFLHLVFHPAPGASEYFVASMSCRTPLMWITFLTSLFALYSFFLWLWPALRLIPSISRRRFDLRLRIRSVPVGIVLAGLLLIGMATVYFMRRQYELKNAGSLKEKSASVLTELQGKFGDENTLAFTDRSYLDYTLSKFSNVLFCEINIFDDRGHLLSSSRPQVVEEGLLGARMNPAAYEALSTGKASVYLATESIGSLGYLSSYLPFFSNKGKLLGYINLPYFSRQDRVEAEISSVLVALLNIYVLILVVSVLATLAIANRITGPLNLLSRQLSLFKLGRKNEPIDWEDSGDEISRLITEYNRMTAELAGSAAMLAESERERAWREMARQVAHEIRNPLTPIRLQAQQLQRFYRDNREEFIHRFPGFADMLIEQIDTLARIAGDFRDFAQMPQTRLETVKLLPLLNQTIQLFRSRDSLHISLETDGGGEYPITGDHEQLVRVFNNLIQNAIQAIPEGQDGIISIRLAREGGGVLVLITDNGIGIPAELQSRIFTPNFTTKSGGMGLGLAMVKAIMDTCGGQISFRTDPGAGTTFVLRFPGLVQEGI
jgi:signal transduction histidine kinase